MTTASRANEPRQAVPFAMGASSSHFVDYSSRLTGLLASFDWASVQLLADELRDCWQSGRHVFLAGNGGSAGNAMHLANDLLYALSKRAGSGLRVEALPANASVLTCLANDEGYEHIFALQLAVKARAKDVLVVFSGSGNSPNIVKALEEARRIGMTSYAIVGYDGGAAMQLANNYIHCAINDMQIAEDMQLIIGHMIMQWLWTQRDLIAR